MDQEHANVALARRLWQATADGEVADLAEVLAIDVVWNASGHSQVSGAYHGPEEVIGYLARVGELTDDFHSNLQGIYWNEGGAVLCYHVSASREERELDMDYVLLLEMKDDQIVRARSVATDQAETDRFWS
jgi:ketosteroid isomerase-like protein